MKSFALPVALCALFLLLAGCGAPPAEESRGEETVSSASSETPQYLDEAVTYPKDTMFVCQDRLSYRDNTMTLRVERLSLENVPVIGEFDKDTAARLSSGEMTKEEQAAFFSTSTGDELLKKGIVLLNNASLPGNNTNANVSLSGHRDIYGREFLHIDTLTKGDLLYLTYGGVEYEYEYIDTTICQPDDWSVTYCTDEPLLTLISCDPVGTSLHRIVVRARLVSTYLVAGDEQEKGAGA